MSKNFSIQETVHRNIERSQFPSFANHRSLVGWCSMNYPKVLQNPIYMHKQGTEGPQYELESLFQQRNPVDRGRPDFVRPFSNNSEAEEKPIDSKTSAFTLATTKHEDKVRIYEEVNRAAEQFSAVKPLGAVLGSNRDGKYERRVRQIGEVYYTPPNQGETMRHLKKLPNTVLNEHNLLEIMDQRLEYLDLQYKADISNDLINKVGYLAPNIRELNLTAVPITNEVLIELGISCKQLVAIDISLCQKIEEFALLRFLKNKFDLRKFKANHLATALSDACLQQLGKCDQLSVLSINFCSQVTSAGVEAMGKHEFVELGLAALPNLKGEDFKRLIEPSTEKIVSLDLSFNGSKQVSNPLMVKVGMCLQLQTLILTGCESISDEGMNHLIYGDKVKGKPVEGFQSLSTLKIGGLVNVSDQLYQLLKRCPALSFVECNNLERLSDHFLDQVKNLPHLRTIQLNFTPNISQQKVKEVRQSAKGLNIVRHITKMTDPTDDGLRMPIPLASLKIKKPKKKKK